MYKTLKIQLNERLVLFKKGLPVRAYGPGRYVAWGRHLERYVFDTNRLTFDAAPEVLAVLPSDWFRAVTLDEDQRAILYRDGRPEKYLRPGTHRFWTLDPSVKLRVLSVSEPVPKLTAELQALIPSGEYLDAVVEAYQAGLLYFQRRFAQTLTPGHYRYWKTPDATPSVDVVDMRSRNVAVAGQELMTRDKVTLRLTLSVDFAVADAKRVCETVSDPSGTVYLAAQLAARDYVAGVTLDSLLEGRDQFTKYLESIVVPKLAAVGVRVERIGVKDVVLPGEMKTLLNRVIEAEKEAAASVILRREETAAMRSLANTARVMTEQPVLLRLKELEAMKEIAERIQEVRVVVGADRLESLLPAKLLDGSS